MNVREVFVAAVVNAIFFVAVFFLVRAGIQFFWGSPREGLFVAPESGLASLPLKREVDFVDVPGSGESIVSQIKTEYGKVAFSTDGAVLKQLSFDKRAKGGVQELQTIMSGPDSTRETGCFLVAFDEKTPYFYRLIGQDENDERALLSYQADLSGGTVTKIFTISKKVPRIDLELKLEVKQGNLFAPRVLFPGPILQATSYDVSSCLYGLNGPEVVKLGRKSLNEQQGWLRPLFFGSDDKFFVHALLSDAQQFCQRAYFKLYGQQGIMSILEGPAVDCDTTWHFSFYCGPKQMHAMRLVDARLEKTLDYSGLLAPLASFMLTLLAFLYAYVHNYGLAIILLTLLVKLLLLPLSWRAAHAQKKNLEFQKKLEYIQQKYKHDRALLQQEKLELIRREGLWGRMAGYLPLLLQVPFFWVLSRVISGSYELYHEPFFGWIGDLSAHDPYYVLPFLFMISMMLNAVYVDAKQRLMLIGFAFIFAVLSTAFSAGLVLYFLTFNVLTLVQNEVQKRVS